MLNKRKQRDLSLKGKILIIKSLAIPKLTRCNYLSETGSVAPPSSFWPMLTVQWFNIIRGDCQARSLLENVDLKKKDPGV